MRLRLVPVLVEAAPALVAQVPSPDRGQGPEATRRFDVAYKAHDPHGWRVEDGDRFHDLLLVELRARLVNVAHDVRHARLEGAERGEMRRLRLVVPREALD